MKFCSLLVTFSLLFCFAAHAEDCAQGPEQIKLNQNLLNSVNEFGDLSHLLGTYQLSGFLGSLTEVKIDLKTEKDAFFVRINNDAYKQAYICAQDKSASRKHNLQIKVLQPKYAENALILLRPAEKGGLFVSAHKSRWRFMKFKRLPEDAPVIAMDEDAKR